LSPITVVDNEFGSLVYHPDKKIIHHTFHQPIGGDSFRSLLSSGIELLKQNNAEKWLSDDRENAALSPEDTEWGQSQWFPQAKAAGWKYWGLVVPADMMARMNMAEFVFNYSQQGVRTQVFTDLDKALRWLESV